MALAEEYRLENLRCLRRKFSFLAISMLQFVLAQFYMASYACIMLELYVYRKIKAYLDI